MGLRIMILLSALSGMTLSSSPSGRGAWWVYGRILLYGEEDQKP